jgi:ABC-type Na+ efflux pump permease subunit
VSDSLTIEKTPMPAATPRVGFSFARVQAIAENTFTESVRQKVFLVLVVVGLALIGSSNLITAFSFQGKIKVVKDLGLAVVSSVGTLMAIIGTAQYLPTELDRKTIYTILSKPARRFEFLLGKYLGTVVLLFITVVFMSILMGAVLISREKSLVEDEIKLSKTYGETQEQMTKRVTVIRHEIRNLDLAKALFLTFIKLCLVASITLFVSTFSSSMIFTVVVSFMIFLCGHLVSTTKDYFFQAWGHWVSYVLAFIPDLNMFNVADDLFVGKPLEALKMLKIVSYGVFWMVVTLLGAHLIFREKEI